MREYFSTYEDHDFAGTIIMGTGQQPTLVLSVIMAIVKGEIKKVGHDNTTDLVRNLSFGTYNKKYSPNRTRADWCVPMKRSWIIIWQTHFAKRIFLQDYFGSCWLP